MMEKAKACELFDTSGKNLEEFNHSTPEGNHLIGWICRERNHKMGSMIIEKVNGIETLQYVQGMPKLHYINSDDEPTNSPMILEKYDGTNLLGFPLIVNGEVKEVLFKTRLMPFVSDRWTPKLSQVLEDKHLKAITNERLSFSFEMYGYQNSHEIDYKVHDISLDLMLLSVLDKGRGLPVNEVFSIGAKYGIDTPFQHFLIDNEDGEIGCTPTIQFNDWYSDFCDMDRIDDFYPNNYYELYLLLEKVYQEINGNYQVAYNKTEQDRNNGEVWILSEGSVWHMGETNNVMVKNKAESVKEWHIIRSSGVPKNIIHKALFKIDENYDGDIRDATIPYVINSINDELLEEYPFSLVYDKQTEDKIKHLFENYVSKLIEEENLENIVSQLREECGADADPSDMMRYYSQLPIYNKNLVGKVYQTIVSMS